jgi:hypothetical protein
LAGTLDRVSGFSSPSTITSPARVCAFGPPRQRRVSPPAEAARAADPDAPFCGANPKQRYAAEARRVSGRGWSFASGSGLAVRTVSTRSRPAWETVAMAIAGRRAARAAGTGASSVAAATRSAPRAHGILRVNGRSGTSVPG